MKELQIEAATENLPRVTAFLDSLLDPVACPAKTRMQIDLVAEEVFVNIASYAYAPGSGTAILHGEVQGDPASVTITFIDRGVPYNPLSKSDPDITLPAEKREIGGLGILLTKQFMDEVSYEYRDGQNILTLKKNL